MSRFRIVLLALLTSAVALAAACGGGSGSSSTAAKLNSDDVAVVGDIHITREQLDRTDVQSVCDLLRRVPGVSISVDAGMGCGASIRGMGSPAGCEPTIYVDDTPFGGSVAEFTRSIVPGDIMGIELYSTATEPAQFPGACGSIVVWTR